MQRADQRRGSHARYGRGEPDETDSAVDRCVDLICCIPADGAAVPCCSRHDAAHATPRSLQGRVGAFGPDLHDVVGQEAGRRELRGYSPAMESFGRSVDESAGSMRPAESGKPWFPGRHEFSGSRGPRGAQNLIRYLVRAGGRRHAVDICVQRAGVLRRLSGVIGLTSRHGSPRTAHADQSSD